MLSDQDIIGSMSRRGNPYDNAKAESLMKTLKVEAVSPLAFETFADVAAQLPTVSTTSIIAVACIPRSAISARRSSRTNTPGSWSNHQPDHNRLKGPTPRECGLYPREAAPRNCRKRSMK